MYDSMLTSDFVIVSIKLYLNVGNDEYIILCNFSDGFEVKRGGLLEPSPKAGRGIKNSRLNEVKEFE